MDNKQEIERIEKELYAVREKIKQLNCQRRQIQKSPSSHKAQNINAELLELKKKEHELQNKSNGLK